ncbi:MAG TPA: ECF-type sigma factor [Casimicrobiaceae bacterium]
MVDQRFESLVQSAEQGSPAASGALFAALYDELHRIARRELWRRGGSAHLSATTLLHEAYLDIAAREGIAFPDQARFLAYAARAMRGLVIDYARNRHAQKRGGGFEITTLDTQVGEAPVASPDVEAIGEALDDLAKVDPDLAQLVDLKFFCGFSFGEIAAFRNVSERTVQRDWEKARMLLHRAMRDPAALD